MNTPHATTSITDLLASLAEPVRLRMLRILEREELSVGEMANVIQLPQSTVSRHLKTLADAGWLIRRSEGTATLYRLMLDDLSALARGVWVPLRDPLSSTTDAADDLHRLRAVLAERRTDSQAYFGRIAGHWDSVRAELFGRDFTSRALLGLLPSDWVVADLGCGTGNVAEALAPVVRRIIAVDASAPMLDAARQRLEGHQNVEFVEAALENLPIHDRAVDAAILTLVLHHIDDFTSAIRQAARILRGDHAGGILMVIDMVRHDRTEYRAAMGHKHLGFTREQILSSFTAVGLKDPRWLHLPTDATAKGPGLFIATARIPTAH